MNPLWYRLSLAPITLLSALPLFRPPFRFPSHQTASLAHIPIHQGLVKAWEAVVDNGLVDPDVLMYVVTCVLVMYYFRAPLLRCCYCCCRVRIRQAKTHETKDLDV